MNKAEFRKILEANSEDEHLEFKEAKNGFDFEHEKGLLDYIVALANEDGGKLILGVPDKKPRIPMGTRAYPNIGKIVNKIYSKIQHKVHIEEYSHDHKRVLIIHIPSRPIGRPLLSPFNEKPRMRTGEGIRNMTHEELARIYSENHPDFSAEICHGLTLSDLDPNALTCLRELWHKKTQNNEVLQYNDHRMLTDLALEERGKFNYAALILLGSKFALSKYLGCAEIIFEYRNKEEDIEYQDRVDYREAFLLYLDALWDKINARNEEFHIQEGFFMRSIKAFNEEVIREAVLNAVAHRDYKHPSSIYIKQYPNKIIIENPGGFLPGITPENIFKVPSTPRNRRLIEIFQKTYQLVERSGQGVDKIFRKTIEEGKGIPDYSQSLGNWVKLILNGVILDKSFLKYLETVSKQFNMHFTIEELIFLEKIRSKEAEKLPYETAKKFLDIGIIDPVGKTRGRRYVLSHKYYIHIGKAGIYTRARGVRGLPRETIKELIVDHLRRNKKGYMKEFTHAFLNMKQQDISNLLQQLKREGKIKKEGITKKSYWVLKVNKIKD